MALARDKTASIVKFAAERAARSPTKVMPIKQWHTEASQIPEARRGRFGVFKQLAKASQCQDLDNVFGYREACFLEDTLITILYEGDNDPSTDLKEVLKGVWMTDSPAEYYAMHELAARTRPGRVLVGGLGLGILSNILAGRDDIPEVVTVESSPEVIGLVKSYLRPKVKVVQGDFLQEMARRDGEDFHTVIADIFKSSKERELYQTTRLIMEDHFPEARHLFWAFQKEYDNEMWQLGLALELEKKRKEGLLMMRLPRDERAL